jgi:hypothetical protein
MKQTAVEFAVEKLAKFIPSGNQLVIHIILEEAKEMEKQQIIEFTNDFIDKHSFGDYDGIVQKNKTVDEYYKETFNK